MRALRRSQREQEPKSPFVFMSERGSPFTTAGFARMMERQAGDQGSPPYACGAILFSPRCSWSRCNSKQHMQQIVVGQFAYSIGREVRKICESRLMLVVCTETLSELMT